MQLITGNIFTSEMQTIVNTVNCVGVMGTGLALEFRYRYPEMYVRYKELCDDNRLDIGKLYLYKSNGKWVLNFPTKRHWKFPTKSEFIELGLQKFVKTYKDKGIRSVAFPLLGSQNGGLDSEHSLLIMEKYLHKLSIPVEVYRYDPIASDDIYATFKKNLLSLDNSEAKLATGLKENRIRLIKEILESNEIMNMGMLLTHEGIGDITKTKCFSFAMNGLA